MLVFSGFYSPSFVVEHIDIEYWRRQKAMCSKLHDFAMDAGKRLLLLLLVKFFAFCFATNKTLMLLSMLI